MSFGIGFDEKSRSNGGGSRAERRRRWAVRLGVLAAIALGLRALLPIAAEIGIERAVSGALRGQLELGDVDLSLLQGAITLEDLRFGEPRDDGELASDAPVQVKRVYTRIAWLDLIERRVRIRALEIDAPRLRLQRRPDSGVDLVHLLAPTPSAADVSEGQVDPERAPSPDSTTSTDEAPTWSVVLDSGVLEAGQLRLVDLAVERPRRWSAQLTELRIQRVAFEPGTYQEPIRLVLEGQLEGAPVSLSAEITLQDGALAYRGELQLQGLPLRQMELYLEDIGWNRLQARVDADLQFEGGSEGQAEVRGSAALRKVTIGVTKDGASALRIGAIEMETSGLVVHERRMRIESLVMRDAELLARAGLPPTLPLLALAEAEAPEEAERVAVTEAPEPPAAAATPDADADAAPQGGTPPPDSRWQIEIKQAEILDSRVRQIDSGVQVVLESARLEGLESGPDSEKAGSLVARLALREGEGENAAERGSLELDGQLALEPASFDGELVWTAIDGPTLNRALASPIALQSLRSAGSLMVRASTEPGQPPLRLSGDLELADLSHQTQDEDALCVVELQTLRLGLEELRLAPPDQDPRPLVIHFAEVELEQPHLELVRTDQGLRCGALLPTGTKADTAANTAADTATDVTQEVDPQASDRIPIEPRARVDRFTSRGGTWMIRDRTVSPFVDTRLESVDATLEGLTNPPLAMQHLEVSARGLGTDPVRLSGKFKDDRLKLELALERVGLAPYNPYLVQQASSVAVERGDLSLRLDLSAQRQRGFEGDLRLVLHDANLTALSPEGFRESFGVSLQLAMALLRNVQGDIVVDAPFSSSAEDGIDLGVGRLMTAALRRALINAIATPLKLVGAVIPGDGGIEDFEMQPIVFEPGGTLLVGSALEQVEKLASVLAQRPWLGVKLEPQTVEVDRSVQAEPDEQEEEPPSPALLAKVRADAIAARLQTDFGVDPERIRVGTVPEKPGSGPPRVAVSILPVGDPLEPDEEPAAQTPEVSRR